MVGRSFVPVAFLLAAFASTWAAEQPGKGPVKVFILVGQSNMQGRGKSAHLEQLVKEKPAEYGHLQKDGKWAERDGESSDFNLGATGARAWVWGWHEASYTSRQILGTQIAADSPADGVLQVGDVILGVDGKPFAADARRSFGKALGKAEETGTPG